MADTLKRLEYFASLAEIEHYSKAAEKLCIAQSALSQQIKALEAELTFRLFEPAGRGVRLTAAGKDYHQSVIDLLALHSRAIEKAKRIAVGEIGQVAICHAGTALSDSRFIERLKNFHSHCPAVDIKLIEIPQKEQLSLLSSRKIDLAVIRAPAPVLPAGASSHVFSRQRLYVAMSSAHRLANFDSVSMLDLKDESLVGYQEPDAEGITSSLVRLAREAGFEPKIDWRVSVVNSAMGIIDAGMAVSLVPESIVRFNISDIVYRELSDRSAWTELIIVWMQDHPSPVQKLVTRFFSEKS